VLRRGGLLRRWQHVTVWAVRQPKETCGHGCRQAERHTRGRGSAEIGRGGGGGGGGWKGGGGGLCYLSSSEGGLVRAALAPKQATSHNGKGGGSQAAFCVVYSHVTQYSQRSAMKKGEHDGRGNGLLCGWQYLLPS